MNIIVLTQSGRVVSRPDTSWEKDSRDIYLPDFVKALSLSPVLFVKVTKPGRSISERFASRYHDSFGFGCLLYAEDLMDSHPEAYASASCLDHTSILPADMLPIDRLSEEQDFRIYTDGKELTCCHALEADQINKAIALATSHCSVRHGDFIAIELAPRTTIQASGEGQCTLEAKHNETQTIKLNIIY